LYVLRAHTYVRAYLRTCVHACMGICLYHVACVCAYDQDGTSFAPTRVVVIVSNGHTAICVILDYAKVITYTFWSLPKLTFFLYTNTTSLCGLSCNQVTCKSHYGDIVKDIVLSVAFETHCCC